MPSFPHIENLFAQHRWKLAIDEIAKLLREYPQDAELHARLALALAFDKKPGEAEEIARMAIRLAPDEAPGHHALALTLINRGQWQAADDALRECRRLEPNSAYYAARQAELRYLEQRHVESVELAREAVRLNSELDWAHEIAGKALLALDRNQDAANHLRAALALDPTDADVLALYGEALTRLGRHQEAAGVLLSAFRQNPGDAQVHDHLIDALQRRHLLYRWLPLHAFLAHPLRSRFWKWLLVGLVVIAMVLGALNALQRQNWHTPAIATCLIAWPALFMLRFTVGSLIVLRLQSDAEAGRLLRMRDRLRINLGGLTVVMIAIISIGVASSATWLLISAMPLAALGVLICVFFSVRSRATRRHLGLLAGLGALACAVSVSVTLNAQQQTSDAATLAIWIAVALIGLMFGVLRNEDWN